MITTETSPCLTGKVHIYTAKNQIEWREQLNFWAYPFKMCNICSGVELSYSLGLKKKNHMHILE